jgi:adenosylcobinamide-GDP ribazoletransferase
MSEPLLSKFRHEWHAFLNSLRFFTRIRVPDRIPHSAELSNHAGRYFPAIGLIVGLICAVTFGIAMMVFPQGVSISLAMATGIFVTGAFHEDGLSDMTDGFGGGWEKARILEIMKDSRVGNYGVIAIVLTLLIKFTCLSTMNAAWVPVLLITGHAFSRYCALLIMVGMDYIREDAQSKSKPLATKMPGNALVVASAFGLLPLLWLPLNALVISVTAALLMTIWIGRKLQKWLGGYTGDCLGAVQQLSELAFYLGALAILH